MIRIAAVVFSNYPADTRVRRESEALVQAGMSVDVICVKKPEEPHFEEYNGVRVHRISISRKRAGKLQYIWEYGFFLIAAALKLSRLFLKTRFDVVHVHNMPDILVFSALFPKLTGSAIILDLHDPMPELFATKYGKSPMHPAIRALKYLEKVSIRFADLVLTPNVSFRNLFISRGCPASKIHIVMNSPVEEIYESKKIDPDLREPSPPDFVLLYSGYIIEHNGLDVAIRAVSRLKERIPNVVLDVYGRGNFMDECMRLAGDLGLNGSVRFHGLVPQEKIAAAVSASHVGVIPNRSNPFTDLNFPTRIFEFLIQEKPVIVPKTRGIQDYFSDGTIHFFDPGNPDSLAEKLLEIHSDPERTREVVKKGVAVYSGYRWASQKKHLVNLVTALVAHPDRMEAAHQPKLQKGMGV
jgi:glycosyltransferase involved in cell wall biosynthesis